MMKMNNTTTPAGSRPQYAIESIAPSVRSLYCNPNPTPYQYPFEHGKSS